MKLTSKFRKAIFENNALKDEYYWKDFKLENLFVGLIDLYIQYNSYYEDKQKDT